MHFYAFTLEKKDKNVLTNIKYIVVENIHLSNNPNADTVLKFLRNFNIIYLTGLINTESMIVQKTK